MEYESKRHGDGIELAFLDESPFTTAREIKDFAITEEKGAALAIRTADEVPFFFSYKKKPLVGGGSYDMEKALDDNLKKDLGALIEEQKLNPSDIYCYFGPALTFSHYPVERDVLEKAIALGYRASAKRTSGVDYLDVPLLLILQVRALGIPFENISTCPYDTFESEGVYYSALRGDTKKNFSYIKLI